MNNNCLRQEKVPSASVLPKLSGVVVFIYSCMNFLTGHHIIAANNLLVHLMLWHVSTVLMHYKWPALPQFSVKTAPDSILRGEIFKIFLGHVLRPPSKPGQHSAKPPTSYI